MDINLATKHQARYELHLKRTHRAYKANSWLNYISREDYPEAFQLLCYLA
jgi:hypothetical protein